MQIICNIQRTVTIVMYVMDETDLYFDGYSFNGVDKNLISREHSQFVYRKY